MPRRGAVDWVFRNRRTGAITVGQFPNAALTVFVVTAVGSLVVRHGWLRTALRLAEALSLAWWAVDEIVRGVNPWRRILGSVVLAGLVVAVVGVHD